MSPEEFEKAMLEIYPKGHHIDEEHAHWVADKLMCRVLTELGYGEGVKIFDAADKWYA